jgi:hypothetical protein
MVFFLTTGVSLAASPGTTGGSILQVVEGAIPAGMGGAFTAIASGDYAIDYNPAGLVSLDAPEAVAMYHSELATISDDYFTFATPINTTQAIALHISYDYIPPINNGNGNPAVNAYDILFMGTYAFKLSNFIQLGASLKYLRSVLAYYGTSAIAVDLGGQISHLPFGLKGGLAIQNLGGQLKYLSVGVPLPLIIRIGLGWETLVDQKRKLELDLDVVDDSSEGMGIRLGGEYWVFPRLFAIRAGINKISQNVYNSGFPPSLGFTLTDEVDSNKYSLDFAYNPATLPGSIVDNTYLVSLRCSFENWTIF